MESWRKALDQLCDEDEGGLEIATKKSKVKNRSKKVETINIRSGECSSAIFTTYTPAQFSTFSAVLKALTISPQLDSS